MQRGHQPQAHAHKDHPAASCEAEIDLPGYWRGHPLDQPHLVEQTRAGANGALAGLVSITAGPATPSLGAAILIGAVGGVLVVLAVPFFDKLKIDDVVGALSVHLVCGIWGTMAVPFTDGEASFLTQFIGVAATAAFVVVASSIVWLVIKYTIGVRCSEEDEYRGLDLAEIGMEAYPDFQTVHLGGMGSPSASMSSAPAAARVATNPVRQN